MVSAPDEHQFKGSSEQRSRKMKSINRVNLILIAFFSVMGCYGSNGNLKTLPESDSKITQKEE
jgi:hypothetical protein